MESPLCLGGRDGEEECGSDDCDCCAPRLEDRCPYECECCFRENEQCRDGECFEGFCRCRSPSPNGYSMGEYENLKREVHEGCVFFTLDEIHAQFSKEETEVLLMLINSIHSKVFEYECEICLYDFGSVTCQCAEEPPAVVTVDKSERVQAVWLGKADLSHVGCPDNGTCMALPVHRQSEFYNSSIVYDGVCLLSSIPECNGDCEGFCPNRCCECTNEDQNCFNCIPPSWNELYRL